MSIDFLNFRWANEEHSRDSRVRNFFDQRSAIPSTLIVCNLYLYQCIRLTHARYIFFVDALSSRVFREMIFQLNDDDFDHFYVDESKIMNVLTSVIIDEKYITLDIETKQIQTSRYRCCLENVLRADVRNLWWKDDLLKLQRYFVYALRERIASVFRLKQSTKLRKFSRSLLR